MYSHKIMQYFFYKLSMLSLNNNQLNKFPYQLPALDQNFIKLCFLTHFEILFLPK